MGPFLICMTTCSRLHKANGDVPCSHYSLGFSKKKPHAASTEAKAKVDLLKSELSNIRIQGTTLEYLNYLRDVHVGSLAMLVCKTLPKNKNRHKYYPCRPPVMSKDCAYYTGGNWMIPAFVVHFDY
jgi:hypothetical protein